MASYLPKTSRRWNSQFWNLLTKCAHNYDVISQQIKTTVKKVLYVGMSQDILLPLLAMNATTIIAVDLIDYAYIRNFNQVLWIHKEKENKVLAAKIIINQIIDMIEDIGGSIQTYKCIESTNKHILTFTCLQQKRKLIYYCGKNYKHFLPKEASSRLDAYLSVGAPSFLTNPKHLQLIQSAFHKTKPSYLLIAGDEKSPVGKLLYSGETKGFSELRDILSLNTSCGLDDIVSHKQNFAKINKLITEDIDEINLYQLN